MGVGALNGAANLLLRTIAAAASRFPAATAAQLADKLLEALKSLQLPPSSAAAHIAALANLCKHKSASAAEAEAVISGWYGPHERAESSACVYTYKCKCTHSFSAQLFHADVSQIRGLFRWGYNTCLPKTPAHDSISIASFPVVMVRVSIYP